MNQPLQRSVGGGPVCSQGLRPLCSAERETLGVRECTCICDESDGLLEFCDGAEMTKVIHPIHTVPPQCKFLPGSGFW